MKLVVTAVFDIKTEQYSSVSTCNNSVDAVRQFEIAKKDPKSILSFYPDFDLLKIAEFDTDTGIFTECKEKLASSGGIENA